jgi:hypothetical protein
MKTLALLSCALIVLVAGPALAQGANHWHVSTYWAEYIEGHGIGNHALYCGDETIPACEAPDTLGGVGGSWVDDVEWRTSLLDTSQPVSVRLTGLMNVDLTDVGWDFLELYIQRGDEADMLQSWTGSSASTVALDFSTVLYPGEFSGPGSDEVRLFWRVWTSTDGWDDEDCLNPSHGACQLDDLSVYLDGYLSTFDDFEPGHAVHWNPVLDVTAVGETPALARVAVDAHPNPFNPKTTIAFDLPRAAEVTLAVFNLQGQRVRELLEPTPYAAGHHEQVWDGLDARGRAVTSGVYFYRFTAERETWTGKLTLLK